MTNQVVKQCYACKAKNHKIKACKKREMYYLDILTVDTQTQGNEREDGAIWDTDKHKKQEKRI